MRGVVLEEPEAGTKHPERGSLLLEDVLLRGHKEMVFKPEPRTTDDGRRVL